MIEAKHGSDTPLSETAAWQIANDPYVRHIVQLTIGGKFSEPAAVASLQEELFERMGELVTGEEMYDAHWAPSRD